MTTIYLANYAFMADYEGLMDDGVRDMTLDDLARPVVAWVSLTLDIDQWKAAIEEDYRSCFEGRSRVRLLTTSHSPKIVSATTCRTASSFARLTVAASRSMTASVLISPARSEFTNHRHRTRMPTE